jgi:hypothetical protein
MAGEREVTAYCGLYCGDCIPSNQSLFDAAEKLREELDGRQFDKYAELKGKNNDVFNDYGTFKKVLSELMALRCAKACINGGGNPDCKIRGCVRGKGLNGCWECPDFESCELLEPLSLYHGDTRRCNLRLIKEYGIEGWADKRGIHYVWDD